MTSKAVQLAEADAARLAAIDAAQQRFRATIEAPLAEYLAATMPARAELEAAEALANQVWAEAIRAANAPTGP